MVDFRPFHTYRNNLDGCVYAKARKKYTRTKPVKSGWHKFSPLPREKATITMFAHRFGYSTNLIAEFFGRSTSYVHRIVRTAITRGTARFIDKRISPNKTRLLAASNRRKMMEKYFPLWQAFLCGEEAEPP